MNVKQDAVIPINYDLNDILRKFGVVTLSNVQPEPPSGKSNISWQTDQFGYISAYVGDASGSSDTSYGTVMYQKSFWNDLNDFIIDPSITATIVNNQIVLNNATGSGTLSNSLTLKNLQTSDENVDFEVTFIAGSDIGTGFNYGFGAGVIGTNTNFFVNFANWVNTVSGQTNSLTMIQGTGAGTHLGTATNLPTPVAAGDLIRIVYSRRNTKFSFEYDNYTQAQHISRVLTDVLIPAKPFNTPNTYQFSIFDFGTSVTITSIKVISRTIQNPNIAFIGDSKTTGYCAVGNDLRFASLLDSLGPNIVFAGSGDKTQDVLNGLAYTVSFKPKNAILCIGYNDLAYGIPTATWQANYKSIVAGLENAGINVIHLLQIPSNNGVDESQINNFIIATYPDAPKINVAPDWNQSLYLASDNIHPNQLGHAYVASQILAAAYIAPQSNVPETYVLPSNANYTP